MKDTNLYAEIGKRIQLRRKELNMTQENLAELMDVTPQMISTAENGSKGIRPENVIKFSKALSVSCDYILTGVTSSTDFDTVIALSKNIPEATYEDLNEILNLLKKLS